HRRMGGARVLKSRLLRSLVYLSGHFDIVVVEGTGGLMVPVNRKRLLIDWVREFRLPVLLVAGNRLGAINHTLLSLEALKSRKMQVLGVVFNTTEQGTDKRILADNPAAVKALSGERVFGTLEYSKK